MEKKGSKPVKGGTTAAVAFDRTKRYPPVEAVQLAQQTARNRFEGKIEFHATVRSTGKLGGWQTEKKAPLVHGVLGKQSETAERLARQLAEFVKKVGPGQITKLVVCATMGPGIKVDVGLKP